RQTARSLRQSGIRYAYSFCPNIHEMPDHNPAEEKSASAPERRRLARAIVESEGQISFDVMEPLRAYRSKDIFVDHCHFNARGVRILAHALAGWIDQWLPPAK